MRAAWNLPVQRGLVTPANVRKSVEVRPEVADVVARSTARTAATT
jgi:hypothetical protein